MTILSSFTDQYVSFVSTNDDLSNKWMVKNAGEDSLSIIVFFSQISLILEFKT